MPNDEPTPGMESLEEMTEAARQRAEEKQRLIAAREEAAALAAIDSADGAHEIAVDFLQEANEIYAALPDLSESFKNAGLYPFESIHTALLFSIANSLVALNARLGDQS